MTAGASSRPWRRPREADLPHPRGRLALRVLRATSLALDREWKAALGSDRLAGFHETLLELLEVSPG